MIAANGHQEHVELAVLDFKNAWSRTMKGDYTLRAEADKRFPIS